MDCGQSLSPHCEGMFSMLKQHFKYLQMRDLLMMSSCSQQSPSVLHNGDPSFSIVVVACPCCKDLGGRFEDLLPAL